MLNRWKYMLFLALAVPAIYAYAPPSLEEMAKPRWLDDISVAINRSLAAQPQAEISSVDPIAAAKVDEDLDYRIAERTNSTEGWGAFLAAHPDGPHAQSARAELDQLARPMTPSAPTAAPVPDTGAADAKVPSGNSPPSLASTGLDAATPGSDEICKGDENRLQGLSNSPTSDGIIRLLIELRCEKLRPQLLNLAKRLDDKAPAAPADAAQDASSNPPPAPGASKDASIQAVKSRTPGSQHRARPSVASHSSEPKRHANHEKAASLPPFLLALFGERPKSSTTRQTRSGGGEGH
jgi:hypothetical protein